MYFVVIYAFFCVNFILQKFCLCKKNDKYQVCRILSATSFKGKIERYIPKTNERMTSKTIFSDEVLGPCQRYYGYTLIHFLNAFVIWFLGTNLDDFFFFSNQWYLTISDELLDANQRYYGRFFRSNQNKLDWMVSDFSWNDNLEGPNDVFFGRMCTFCLIAWTIWRKNINFQLYKFLKFSHVF